MKKQPRPKQKSKISSMLACAFMVGMVTATVAQELTPRQYWPAPKGTKVLVFGYVYSSGDVLMDPSIPLYGVDSKIHTGLVAYLQTISLWGRSANFIVELPYSWGKTKGRIYDTPASKDFAGFNDLGVTLSFNLLGAPSMNPKDFMGLRADPRPILGASLKVLAPTGHYEKGKLINVGSHRWSFKTELGYIHPLAKKWLLELDLGVWFFTADKDFLVGVREQNPLAALQAHLVRRFKAGFWAALDVNYFTGGQQTIGGGKLIDWQHNSRIGLTVVVPFLRRHAIKAGYSIGAYTKYGNDFNQLVLSYQVVLN
jgi:hypothetical protein